MSLSPSLLLVDDDDDAHYFLHRTLARARIQEQLDVVSSGESAIEYFNKCAAGDMPWPTVVFLYIKMPGLTGFDILGWLRERGFLGLTVVAMMSTSDDPKDISRAYSLGAHTYLRKGVNEEVLGPLVRSAIEMARRREPRP